MAENILLRNRAERSKEPVTPKIDDRYEILDLVGEGGMGLVYRAQDVKTGTYFAIKVLKQDLQNDKAAIKRFEQEIDAITKLQHDKIVSVYGHGRTADGAPYLVMEYLDAKKLSESCFGKGGLKPTVILKIFIDLCEALEHAHSNGVLHRDLKPSNVLVANAPDGGLKVWLVDFGLARMLNSGRTEVYESQNLSATTELFGTPAYMSPEQCLGFKLDERSDIYSLGCSMYEMVTGRPPFGAANAVQLVVKHLNEQPPVQRRLKRNASADIELIISKCLEKRKEDRYQSVKELLNDLKELQNGKAPAIERIAKEREPVHPWWRIIGLFIGVYWVGFTYLPRAFYDYMHIDAIDNRLIATLFSIGILVMLLPNLGWWLSRATRRRFTASQQWELLIGVFFVLLSLSAIVAKVPLIESCDPWIVLFDNIWPVSIVLHAVCAIGLLATLIGGYFLSSNKPERLTNILKKFGLIVAPMVALYLGHIPEQLASSGEFQAHSAIWPSTESDRKSSKGVTLLNAAHMLDNNNLRANIYLGSISLSERKYESALTYFDKAIAVINDPFPGLFARRAIARHGLGQLKQALVDADKAIALENENEKSIFKGPSHRTMFSFGDLDLADLYKIRADLYLDNRRTVDAIRDYSKSISILGDYGSLHVPGSPHEGRCIAYWKLGKRKQAIKDLTTKIGEDNSADLLLQRAHLYELIGDKLHARKDIQKAAIALKEDDSCFPIPHTEDELNDGHEYLIRAYTYSKLGERGKASKFLVESEKGFGLGKQDLLPTFCRRLGTKLRWGL